MHNNYFGFQKFFHLFPYYYYYILSYTSTMFIFTVQAYVSTQLYKHNLLCINSYTTIFRIVGISLWVMAWSIMRSLNISFFIFCKTNNEQSYDRLWGHFLGSYFLLRLIDALVLSKLILNLLR